MRSHARWLLRKEAIVEYIARTKFPETWDAYYDAGKKLKAKGPALGAL
jgi:hypothetical protein